jgi:hypothetical protein
LLKSKLLKIKYFGGLEAFKENYPWGDDFNNQEDDELFAIASMNSDEHEIEELTLRGLSFDVELQRSDDFTIVNRYGGAEWSVSWLEHGYSFAWHIYAKENYIAQAKGVDLMTMDKIGELFEEGNNPFKTIRSC